MITTPPAAVRPLCASAFRGIPGRSPTSATRRTRSRARTPRQRILSRRPASA